MLYSSCKSPLLEIVETQLWMQIVRKVSAGGVYGYFLHPCLPFLMENYNCLCHCLVSTMISVVQLSCPEQEIIVDGARNTKSSHGSFTLFHIFYTFILNK